MDEPEACLVTTPLISQEMSRYDLLEADKVFASNDLMGQIYETADFIAAQLDPEDERAIAALIEEDCRNSSSFVPSLVDASKVNTTETSRCMETPPLTRKLLTKEQIADSVHEYYRNTTSYVPSLVNAPKDRIAETSILTETRPLTKKCFTRQQIDEIVEEAVDRIHPHHAEIVKIIEDVGSCAPALTEISDIKVTTIEKDNEYRVLLYTDFRPDMSCERAVEYKHSKRWHLDWFDLFTPHRGIEIVATLKKEAVVHPKKESSGDYIVQIPSPIDVRYRVDSFVKDKGHQSILTDVITSLIGDPEYIKNLIIKPTRPPPSFSVILIVTKKESTPSALRKRQVGEKYAYQCDITWTETPEKTVDGDAYVVIFRIKMQPRETSPITIVDHRSIIESVAPFPVSHTILSVIDTLVDNETIHNASIVAINDTETTPHHYATRIVIGDASTTMSVARMAGIMDKYRETLRTDIRLGVRDGKTEILLDMVYLKKIETVTQDTLYDLIHAVAPRYTETAQKMASVVNAVIDPSKVKVYAARIDEIAKYRYCVTLDIDDTIPIVPDVEREIIERLNRTCAISFRHEYMQNAPIRRVSIDIYCRSYITRRVSYTHTV